MNIIQLVKYDMYSMLRSPLTYLAIILGLSPASIIYFTSQQEGVKGMIDVNTYLSMFTWIYAFIGILFIIKTLTRDVGQGTIQLFLNSKRHRINYIVAKTLSVICIAIIMTAIIIAFTSVAQNIMDIGTVKTEKYVSLLWFVLILHLFFGTLLNIITSVVPKPALIYAIGIFLIFIVPFITPLIGIIPKIGSDIIDALKYVPFSYLTEKMAGGPYTFTNWQWFISGASIAVFFVGNIVYTLKKDI